MTITNTAPRSIFVALLAMTGLISLAAHVPVHAANSGQASQDTDKKKEMTKTESGLKYRDIKEGTGEPPTKGHTCVVHYTGWLWVNGAKGEKVDSSVDRGVPYSFHVGEGEMIKGWDEGVLSMRGPGPLDRENRVSGKRELLIPPDLAFGARGAGGRVPPNATLFYEIELLEIWEKLENGLEYYDTKIGTGAEPKPGQTCSMHYTGWLWKDNAKGKKFDSSADGDPYPFALGKHEVIKGWEEAAATMKVGGKRKVLIPPKLGYGDRGFGGGVIPPKATLFFDLELMKVR